MPPYLILLKVSNIVVFVDIHKGKEGYSWFPKCKYRWEASWQFQIKPFPVNTL